MLEHEAYMEQALELAAQAALLGEVPVGCVIVAPDGQVVGRGFNERERASNVLAHAELTAIQEACRRLNDWRLTGCRLYVTLEPCPMCAGAIWAARVARLYYGARDDKAGAVISRLALFEYGIYPGPAVYGGLMAEACAALLSDFFQSLRRG